MLLVDIEGAMLAVQRLVNGSKQEHSLNSLLSSQQLAVVLAQIAVIFSMLHQKRCWCNPDKYIVRTVCTRPGNEMVTFDAGLGDPEAD